MAFHDLSFLFLFFPAALLLSRLMPGVVRNAALLLLSLLFYAWGDPDYVPLLVMYILFSYFSGLQIQNHRDTDNTRAAKLTLISAVAANLALLCFFKYSGVAMPIGVSFFTFSILSYLFDVYRGKSPAAQNPLDFALFVAFFPKLVSGPIVQYTEFHQQLHAKKRPVVHFGRACRLFVMGLAKKVVLANTLGNTFYALSALPAQQLSTVSAWLGAVSYGLMLYFDFSGYSDMAIALAEMFGFRFQKNFDYPYMSASITEFWRRWHISLGAWFRDYVYIPLGGSRVGTLKNIRNLFVVWALTGIWHGASWNFVFWGLYYGVLLMVEKYVLKDLLERIPVVLRRALTLLLVLIGWVFFFSPDLGGAFAWLGAMFGKAGAGWCDGTARYYLASGWLPMGISAVSAFPLGSQIGDRISRRGKPGAILSAVWLAVLLVMCIAGMMRSTYSSFLYFQF